MSMNTGAKYYKKIVLFFLNFRKLELYPKCYETALLAR